MCVRRRRQGPCVGDLEYHRCEEAPKGFKQQERLDPGELEWTKERLVGTRKTEEEVVEGERCGVDGCYCGGCRSGAVNGLRAFQELGTAMVTD